MSEYDEDSESSFVTDGEMLSLSSTEVDWDGENDGSTLAVSVEDVL